MRDVRGWYLAVLQSLFSWPWRCGGADMTEKVRRGRQERMRVGGGGGRTHLLLALII